MAKFTAKNWQTNFLGRITKAYKKTGYEPVNPTIQAAWIDKYANECCPMSAIAIAEGGCDDKDEDVIIAYCQKKFGKKFVDKFIDGYDSNYIERTRSVPEKLGRLVRKRFGFDDE